MRSDTSRFSGGTIIVRIPRGWGDHQTRHRLGGSRTSNLIVGNLTAKAFIKHR